MCPQLHQLRGRVGHRTAPDLLADGQASRCLPGRWNDSGGRRFQRRIRLARIDLEQRREGDVLGSLQSGGKSSLHFHCRCSTSFRPLIADARGLAEDVVSADLRSPLPALTAGLVDGISRPKKVACLDKS